MGSQRRFFDLVLPDGEGTAVLVEVPHAGLEIPQSVASRIVASHRAMLRDSDIYVDKLFEDAPLYGASMVSARVSRYVVDLNRAAIDIDSRAVPLHPNARSGSGRGVVWRATSDGEPILRSSLTIDEFDERIALFYAPYHAAIAQQIDRLRALHGHVIVLAAHSMPSVHRSGSRGSRLIRRADIVPGTLGKSSACAAVIDMVDAHFRAAGLSVAHDEPYKGGYTTSNYGDLAGGCHVLQLEINRALYVDEASSEKLEPQFAELQATINQLVQKLGALELGAVS